MALSWLGMASEGMMEMKATTIFSSKTMTWRVVDAKTGRIAKTHLGNPLDGGGHGYDERKAARQAKHVNEGSVQK